MKRTVAVACLSMGLGLSSTAAFADCGEVSIVAMNWQSAEVLAALDAFILKEGYGCDASIISGDTVPSITSMVETGKPDLAPEGWIDLVPEVIARGMEEGRLVKGALALSDGAVQGWWIPKYLADANPEIKTIDDALAHPELFPDAEDASKGAVFNGPQGWGGTVVTTQLFKAYDGEAKGFKLIDTGSSAGLDGSIARAYENKQGWLGYYWAPTALLGKYEMVKLDHGAEFNAEEWKRCNSNADCADPQKNDWPGDTVQTVMTQDFATRAPAEVKAYLDTRSWSNATVNGLMAWMTDNQATGEDGARHFLENNADIWTTWVSPEAAEKIKAAL